MTPSIFAKRISIGFAFNLLAFGALFGQVAPNDSILQVAKSWAKDLASPEMEGRGYQAEGHTKAANYIAARFEAIGLKPLPALADQPQPYFQSFHMSTNLILGDVGLSLNGIELKEGDDFIVNAASGRGDLQNLKVRDLKYGMPEDFGKSLENTIVVIRQGLPPEIEKDTDLKKANQANASDARKIELAMRFKAKAIIFIRPKLTAGLSPMPIDIPVVDLLADKLPKKKLKTASILVNAGLKGLQSQNVMGMVEGSKFKDSVLIVCAHYDHLGRQGDAIFYGGNDNASGTSMMLSMAAHFAKPENRPTHSMLFVGFGGEEAGLLGSTHFAGKAPLVPLPNISFLLNLDLMANGADGIMAVAGSDYPTYLEIMRKLNTEQKAVPEVKSRPNAPNSDHYPFVSRGVKGMFIYTMGGPSHYHDVQDTYEHMEFQRYMEVRGLMISFLNEVMGLAK